MQIVKQLFPISPQPEDLLTEIETYIKRFDSIWFTSLSPEDTETIQSIEQFAKETFKIQLPESYLSYLAHMGKKDGNLIMKTFDYDDCTDFTPTFLMDDIKKNKNGYGQSFLEDHIYPFCYAMLCEKGYGFSAKSTDPEQIAMIQYDDLFHAPDTFSKLLFYFAFHYVYATCLSGSRLANLSTEIPQGDPKKAYATHIFIRQAEKHTEKQSRYTEIIDALEREFEITECWFSTGKQQYLSDTENQMTTNVYDLCRYVGRSVSDDFGLCIQQNGFCSWIDMISYGTESVQKVLHILQSCFPECEITTQTGTILLGKTDWRNSIRKNGVRIKEINFEPASYGIISKASTLTVKVQMWDGTKKKLIFRNYRAMKDKFSGEELIGDVLIQEQSPFLSEFRSDMKKDFSYAPKYLKSFVFMNHRDRYEILEVLAESVTVEPC